MGGEGNWGSRGENGKLKMGGDGTDVPHPTGWAKLCRAYGAGWLPGKLSAAVLRPYTVKRMVAGEKPRLARDVHEG